MKPIGSDPSKHPERRLALHPAAAASAKMAGQKMGRDAHELLSFPNLTCVLMAAKLRKVAFSAWSAFAFRSDRNSRKSAIGRPCARLRSCDAFVGHDSGITHLAAAAVCR